MMTSSFYRGSFKRGQTLKLVGRVTWSGCNREEPWKEGGRYLNAEASRRGLTQVNRQAGLNRRSAGRKE